MSTRTIRLPYTCESEDREQILNYITNYNWVLRFTYNRLKDHDFDLSTKELTRLQKSMNNVFVDSHFLNSAQYQAKQFKKTEGNVVFGGKQNFLDRCNHKITNEEFNLRKLQLIFSVGEAIQKGNRKFRIVDESTLIFQPYRKYHFRLHLPKLKENYRRDILKLLKFQNECMIPITYKMDLKYIYISFEDSLIDDTVIRNKIVDRIFGIDLNPNYIGWSVVDWNNSSDYKLIDAGVISSKEINDIEHKMKKASDSPEKQYIFNKRKFENIDTALYLAKLANHYQCQIFAIEDLNMKTKDSGWGKRYNKLVNNQWNRNIFYQQLRKYCDRFGIQFQEVAANYSSFEGNLIYRKTRLPDMCLASIEIGRRGYEFFHQYVEKDRPKDKNIIFDNSEKAKERIMQSLEELHYFDAFDDVKSLYYKLKTLDVKYRVPLENSCLQAVSRKKSIKSLITLYSS